MLRDWNILKSPGILNYNTFIQGMITGNGSSILKSIVVLLTISTCCQGQHAVVIPGHSIVYTRHTGRIEYITGAWENGIFQYADMEFPDFNLKLFSDDGKKIQKRILLKDISEIVLLGHDPGLNDMDSTYFKKLGNHHRIYRQLSFGDTKIFDNLFTVDENPGRIGNQFAVIQDSVLIFISDPEHLGTELRKLPKPVPVKTGYSVKDIIIMLNPN
jgi:hypothetical protein